MTNQSGIISVKVNHGKELDRNWRDFDYVMDVDRIIDSYSFTPGTHYRHFKGGLYSIVALIPFVDGVLKHTVIYKNSKDEVFARSLENFTEITSYEGKFVPRFTMLKEGEK